MHKDLIETPVEENGTNDVLKPEDFLNIPPVETSVKDIKDLIEEWEINADKFIVESSGEVICRKSPGVK